MGNLRHCRTQRTTGKNKKHQKFNVFRVLGSEERSCLTCGTEAVANIHLDSAGDIQLVRFLFIEIHRQHAPAVHRDVQLSPLTTFNIFIFFLVFGEKCYMFYSTRNIWYIQGNSFWYQLQNNF